MKWVRCSQAGEDISPAFFMGRIEFAEFDNHVLLYVIFSLMIFKP